MRSQKLIELLKPLYKQHEEELLFHGWHHVTFVRSKVILFSKNYAVDHEIVEVAALTHDLNYLIEANSEVQLGANLRRELLEQADYSASEILTIESIIQQADTASRSDSIPIEAQLLSDADTAFKVQPITQLLFTQRYIEENDVDLAQLAQRILSKQKPLLEKGIYFYTKEASDMYLSWAQTNIQLWEHLQISLRDADAQELLDYVNKR